MKSPVPTRFRVVRDPSVKVLNDGLWFGGSPARVVRLTPAGQSAWRELRQGRIISRSGGVLARALTDAGLAHPIPPITPGSPDLTVVIPVRDRPRMLARCLAALDSGQPVIVVDDGSREPDAVAKVATLAGAKLLRHMGNRGPAAARNTGLNCVTTELVAFLDSDCVPSAGWSDRLASHFADPLVAAVAPRITAFPESVDTRPCGLDLGDSPARVAPNSKVSFVPTAALVVRRSAMVDIAKSGYTFDPAMRVGEDVDLVWRLHEAGWRVRYDPSVRVGHDEPSTMVELLSRRYRYGTSAAPLALRHPNSISPLVIAPGPAVTAVSIMAGCPILATIAFVLSFATSARTTRAIGLPARSALAPTAVAILRTWLGIGRFSTQFAAPLVAAVLLAAPSTGRRAQRWRRRLSVGSLLIGPALATSLQRRPRHRIARSILECLTDDMAYGAGVWRGCLRHRTLIPLRPRVIRPKNTSRQGNNIE